MKTISIAITSTYSLKDGGRRYIPIIKGLSDKLEFCYGIGFPRNYSPKDIPLDKMRLTKLPTRVAMIVSRLGMILALPRYSKYLVRVEILDSYVAKRLKDDKADVLLVNPVLVKTVRKAKQMGKTVVAEAGNSEPYREYKKCEDDYLNYGIKHKHIYGNKKFEDRVKKSLELADHIVSISNVSLKTYLDANYNPEKFKLIPLTGTDFPVATSEIDIYKERAFISTAFHSFVKGTHRLLLAWDKASIKDIPLIIVGDICEDLQEFINKYGPFNNVIYAGHRSDLKEWYKNYNAVGVLMSLSEGAGRTTPEMMSFGFPMIVSQDATCDIVVNGLNGYVVDLHDEDRIVEILHYFAEDWNRVLSMRKDVVRSVKMRTMEDYSIELMAYLCEL